jgi:hypothetical protein
MHRKKTFFLVDLFVEHPKAMPAKPHEGDAQKSLKAVTTNRLNFLKESFDKEYVASLVPHTSKRRERDPILQPKTGRAPQMDFTAKLSSQTYITGVSGMIVTSSRASTPVMQRPQPSARSSREEISVSSIHRLQSRKGEIEAELEELEKLVLSRQASQAEAGRSERPFAMFME